MPVIFGVRFIKSPSKPPWDKGSNPTRSASIRTKGVSPMSHRRTAGRDAAVCPEMTVLFPLLGHEIRCEILKRLALGSSNVSTLAGVMEMEKSGVSSHLGDLLENGLVTYEPLGKKHFYRLSRCIGVQLDEEFLKL